MKFLKDNAAAAAVAKKQAAVAAAVPTFDGVAAVALLSSPELVSNAKMLIAVARGGLLNAYPSRQSARAGMALTMATNPVASPFPKEAFLSDSSDLTVYLVPLLKDLVKSNSESHKDLWTAEDALYASTLDAIKKDVIKVEVYDNFDLAVVEIPAEVPKYHEGALMSEIVYPGSAAGNGDAPAAVADADPVESKAPGRVLVNHGNETTFSYTQLSTIRLLAHPDSASRQHDLKPLTDLLNSYERKVPPGPGGTTFWELAKDGKGFRCRGSGLQWSLVKDRVGWKNVELVSL